MDRQDFYDWLDRLVAKYPQVTQVCLVGSRSKNRPSSAPREDSDWDVLVCLDADCYDENSRDLRKVEQRVAFDPEVKREEVEVFFLRPDGSVGRWHYGPDGNAYEAAARLLGKGELDMSELMENFVLDCVVNGVPVGDFSRFHEELKYKEIVYERGCVNKGQP